MTAPIPRLDLEPQFLEMSGAISDLARLSSIAETYFEKTIYDAPECVRKLLQETFLKGYTMVMLTSEEHQNVLFMVSHIKSIAQIAAKNCEAVEKLIVEGSR